MTLFTLPELWLALFLGAIGLALMAWRLRLAWWPAGLLRFLLVAMTLMAFFSVQLELFNQLPTPKRQVMVIDQSDSLAESTRLQALEQAVRWQALSALPITGARSTDAAEQPNRSIVVFGSEAFPLLEQNDQVEAALPQIDGRASNLSAALELAGDILAGSTGQVLLVSDGLVSQPAEVHALATNLAQLGYTLDVIPLTPRPMENDLAVGSLIAPKNLWTGTSVRLLVPVIGAGNSAPQLRLRINGVDSDLSAAPAEDNSFPGQAAVTFYHFQIPSLPKGMVTVEVIADTEALQQEDPFTANNRAYSVVQVFEPPRVLLVTDSSGTDAVNRFSQVLTQKQIQLDLIRPDQLTTNLEALQQYRVIFIDNLLANQINSEQMTALDLFVSRLAGGLVFLGGRNSYTSGGYQGTPIEAMLPVKLDPPPRTQRPPMVFQLILDRSSSMSTGQRESGHDVMALAREAAMRSIETLQAQDFLGVLTFSGSTQWDVPLRPLGGEDGLEQALDAVSKVTAQGTTSMFQAMQETIDQVIALPPGAPQSRHILLLSDGQSSDGTAESFKALAEAARAQGITISTIALGANADAVVMEQIAEAGEGRFYEVADASKLPRILVAESEAARSENIQPGQTSLRSVEAGHPIFSGIRPDQLPLLNAYNALQSKAEEGAEDILVSASFGDPILSAWQYGLGRVAAWTGDLGGEWTENWQPESEGTFWSQVIRYMLVDPAQNPAQASVTVEPTRMLVEAAIYTPTGDSVNLAEVRFTYSDSTNKTTTYPLTQKSAGIYQAEIPRPPDGAYRGVLTYPGEDGIQVEVPAPFAVNPPLEWQPEDPSTGVANLTQWSAAGGGQITNLEAAEVSVPKQANPFEDGWWRLLLALVILWPLEIAIRRRWLPWME